MKNFELNVYYVLFKMLHVCKVTSHSYIQSNILMPEAKNTYLASFQPEGKCNSSNKNNNN